MIDDPTRESTTLPEWLVDDTADITNGRLFVAHTEGPALFGEILPEDDAPIDGLTVSLSGNLVLCRIVWLTNGDFDDQMIRSLAEALEHHDDVRG